jgi:NAD(P)-dependent dehydrogenase (short-subunit alcohol dehydrogenase family)
MEITGTSSVITGGASGLGEATARLLADEGAHVVVVDMNEEKGEAVAKDIGGVFVKANVADTDEVIAAIEAAKEMGPLKTMVTAAGIGDAQRTIGRDGAYESAFDIDRYRKVVEVNLIGTFNCVRLGASAMSLTEADDDGCKGAIVTVTSVAAFDGQIGQAAYSSSKGGVVGMTLPVARDLSAAGIRLNCIAPGLIDTPIYGEGEASEAFKDHLGQSVLFPKRLGKPEEFASMAHELLTNAYMNAHVVRLDGGIRMPPK